MTTHGNPDGSPKETEDIQSDRLFSPGSRWEYVARCSAYVLIFLAVLSGFFYVHAFGVNLYWWDDWDTVPVLFEQYADGTLSAAKFWELHNEHRTVFPELVMLGLGLLTNGNALANMYFIEVMLLAILTIYIIAFRGQFPGGPAIWLMAPMAFLVFSLRQYDIMLWGIHINFTLVVAAALGAFLTLSRLGNQRYLSMFISAILAATVASYSLIQGLLVWPIGLGQLLIAPLANRLKFVLITAWTIIGAGEWMLYFLNWIMPEDHPALGFSWDYLFTLVGGSLSGNQTVALVAGMMILALATIAVVVVLIRRQWTAQSFWLATMAFSLATLTAITVGRSGFNTSQSRYSTFSIPLVVATYVVFASQNGRRTGRICTSSMGAILGLAILGCGISFIEGLKMGHQYKEIWMWQQLVICTIDSQPDEMILVHPDKNIPRKYSAVLKKLKYNVFADPDLCARCQLPDPSLPVLAAATRYEIDDIAPMPSNNNFMSIHGWAVDLPAGDVAGGVTVVIDGIAHQARYGMRSDNAANKLDDKKYLYSGFHCVVPAKEIGPGQHTIGLKILSGDNKGIFEVVNQFILEP